MHIHFCLLGAGPSYPHPALFSCPWAVLLHLSNWPFLSAMSRLLAEKLLLVLITRVIAAISRHCRALEKKLKKNTGPAMAYFVAERS